MPDPAEVAERLIAYDRRLAVDVLELIIHQLGGPAADGSSDVWHARQYLAQLEVARTARLVRLSDPTKGDSSTAEWKAEFAHAEHLRALGVALADALS